MARERGSRVLCPRCQHESRPQAKFCEECGGALTRPCPNCGAQFSASAKFCSECAHPLAEPVVPPRYASPESYTPKHLAEKILTSRSALKGERKQVTVLFADLKGSMELLADRDPEEARKILDPVLERMMEAVHHYEGTVNQVIGDGIMALFGAPIGHEDHAVRACYAALRMQRRVTLYADEIQRAGGTPVQIRVGLNSARWSSAPSAVTCTWTTPRSGRPHTWPPGWSRWRSPGPCWSPRPPWPWPKAMSKSDRSGRSR